MLVFNVFTTKFSYLWFLSSFGSGIFITFLKFPRQFDSIFSFLQNIFNRLKASWVVRLSFNKLWNSIPLNWFFFIFFLSNTFSMMHVSTFRKLLLFDFQFCVQTDFKHGENSILFFGSLPREVKMNVPRYFLFLFRPFF